MQFEKPLLYFRRRENSAAVYALNETNSGRLEMQQVAVVKYNGEIKPQNKVTLTTEQIAEINAWAETRKEGQAARDNAMIDQLVGELNKMSQWIQADATNDQVRAASEPLLLAMHDLRSTIVRQLGNTNK